MIIDYLIIGQGLAGSAVALELHRLGKSFVVLDFPAGNSSSRIAAGLFNPVSGKQMSLTWEVDSVFTLLHRFYREAEWLTNRKFFFPMTIYRPFLTVGEQNDWFGKSASPAYQPYLAEVATTSQYPYLNDPFGGLLLQNSGYLDTLAYIGAVRELLLQANAYQEARFSLEELVTLPDGFSYRNESFRKVIFCTGTELTAWWNWLPVKPLKGQILWLGNELTPPPDRLINRNIYLVPQGNRIKLGATYEHSTTPGVTDEGRADLLGQFSRLFKVELPVLGQDWGFRPTTPDRRPLVGVHPQQQNIGIVTGLGTKGVSLAPMCAQQLIQAMEFANPVNKMIDIARYKSLYSGSPS